MGSTTDDDGDDDDDAIDADVAVVASAAVAAGDDDEKDDGEMLAWWAPRPPLPTTLAYLGPPPILGLDSNASITLMMRMRMTLSGRFSDILSSVWLFANIF